MACDMPEPCKFPSIDSYQRRFLWTQKEVDLAPHLVDGIVLRVGGTQKFSHVLGFENLYPFSESANSARVLQPYGRTEVTGEFVGIVCPSRS